MNPVYVISDLHIAAGGQLEDFHADRQFADFLGSLDGDLIINGDFFDFLQVVDTPLNATPYEKKFGFGTSPKETLWKLDRIKENHPLVFYSIQKFSKKYRITLTKGNHDIELHWPGVRKELKKYGIQVNEWFVYEQGKYYIEHGNQYDSINVFPNFLSPELPGAEEKIQLPIGSFFVRYFSNFLERKHHEVDNIKPPQKYLLWALKNDPVALLSCIRQYFPFFYLLWLKSRSPFTSDSRQFQREQHIKAMSVFGKKADVEDDVLQFIDNLKAEHILSRRYFFYRVMREQLKMKFYLADAAQKIGRLLQVPYVMMGHTHMSETVKFGSTTYINSGTWTEKLVNGEHSRELNYVKLHNGKAELLEWKP